MKKNLMGTGGGGDGGGTSSSSFSSSSKVQQAKLLERAKLACQVKLPEVGEMTQANGEMPF